MNLTRIGNSAPFLVLLACMWVWSACGYGLVHPHAPVPDELTRLYLAEVGAGDGDPVFADQVRRNLRMLIRRQGRFTVMPEAGSAQVILRVELEEPYTRAVAYDEYDEVLDYETTVVARARLDGPDGQEMWRADGVSSTRGHAAVAEAVLSSSADFVGRELLAAPDLAAMDLVQLGEARRAWATEALAEDLARAIHSRLMGGY